MDAAVFTPGFQAYPIQLFDLVATQLSSTNLGSTQKGKRAPTTNTIATLPSQGNGYGGPLPILNAAGNQCGAVFVPNPLWDSVILDLIAVNGQQASKTLTIEIGRFSDRGQMTDMLASALLTSSTDNTGSITANPLIPNTFTTQASGLVNTALSATNTHAAANWTTFDATTITSLGTLAQVLQESGGSAGNLTSRIRINIHDVAYYYVILTDADASFTELLTAITPVS